MLVGGTPSPELPRSSFEKEDATHAASVNSARHGSSQAYTVAVIAYGSRYDVPVTGSTRVMSVLREVAEMAISFADAEALGDVDAALFHEQIPLSPDTALRTLPKDCVLHFHTSIDTLVARGKAGSFVRVTDLMRDSGAAVPLQSYPRTGHSLSHLHPAAVIAASRGTATSFGAGDADDAARSRMLQNHLQYAAPHRASVSFPFTPTGIDDPLTRGLSPTAASVPYPALELLYSASVPRGLYTAAPPGNPWGLEERGPTYRVPIRASQDFLAAAAAPDDEAADPGAAPAPIRKEKKKGRGLTPMAVNTAGEGRGKARPASRPLSAVKKRLRGLAGSAKQSSASYPSEARTEEAGTAAAPPPSVAVAAETVPNAGRQRRKRAASKTIPTPSSGTQRNGYYEPSEAPTQAAAPVAAAAAAALTEGPLESIAAEATGVGSQVSTAATTEEGDKSGDVLVEEIAAPVEGGDPADSGEDAQHRILLFDRRGLGPHAPALQGGKRKKYLRYLRVLRIAPVSAIRAHFSIDSDKRLYIGAVPIDDESATVEATVVFLGDRDAPATVLTFAEPNRTPRRRASDLSAESAAEAALRLSQELYHERAAQQQQQRASPPSSPPASPRGAATGVAPVPPPPLPMPSEAVLTPRADESGAQADNATEDEDVVVDVDVDVDVDVNGDVETATATTAAGHTAAEPRRSESTTHKRRKQYGATSRSRSNSRRSSSSSVGSGASSPTARTEPAKQRAATRRRRHSVLPLSSTELQPPSASASRSGGTSTSAASSTAAKEDGTEAMGKTSRSRVALGKLKRLGAKVRRSSSPTSPPSSSSPSPVAIDAAARELSEDPDHLDTTQVGTDCVAAAPAADGPSAEPVAVVDRQEAHAAASLATTATGGGGTTMGSPRAEHPKESDPPAPISPSSILQRDSTIAARRLKSDDSQPQPRFGSNVSTNSTRRRSVSVDSPGDSLISPGSEHSLFCDLEQEAGSHFSVPPPLPDVATADQEPSGEALSDDVDVPSPDEASASHGRLRITVRDPRFEGQFHFNIPVDPGCAAVVVRAWMTECLRDVEEERARENGAEVEAAAAIAAAAVDDFTDEDLYDLYCGSTRITDPAMTFAEATKGRSDCIFSLYKINDSAAVRHS